MSVEKELIYNVENMLDRPQAPCPTPPQGREGGWSCSEPTDPSTTQKLNF